MDGTRLNPAAGACGYSGCLRAAEIIGAEGERERKFCFRKQLSSRWPKERRRVRGVPVDNGSPPPRRQRGEEGEGEREDYDDNDDEAAARAKCYHTLQAYKVYVHAIQSTQSAPPRAVYVRDRCEFIGVVERTVLHCSTLHLISHHRRALT